MTSDVTQIEWKLINQCAKKEYQRLHARTNLSLEWFINAGYVGLIERKQFIKRWNSRYVWLSILSGIQRELRVEFDRRKQRDGTYRTMLTFSDVDPHWCDRDAGEDLTDNYIDSLVSRQSEHDKDCKATELWDHVESKLTPFEFKVTKLWADGYTNEEAARLTGEKISTVRYRRVNAIKKLQEVL